MAGEAEVVPYLKKNEAGGGGALSAGPSSPATLHYVARLYPFCAMLSILITRSLSIMRNKTRSGISQTSQFLAGLQA